MKFICLVNKEKFEVQLLEKADEINKTVAIVTTFGDDTPIFRRAIIPSVKGTWELSKIQYCYDWYKSYAAQILPMRYVVVVNTTYGFLK